MGVHQAVYSHCTQEMYDFDEYENPETRFVPRDEFIDSEKVLEQAKNFDFNPIKNAHQQLTGPYAALLGRE